MAHAVVGAVSLTGLAAEPVRVECSTGQGLPGLRLIGLPDAAVREAAERVRAAFHRLRLPWPDSKIVVNLAPAALRKVGKRRAALIGLEGQHVAQVAADEADIMALDWTTAFDE